MDLRTVKHFIWKQSGDLTLHYRLLNRWLCQRYRTWTYQFYKHYVGRHCTKVVHPFMTSMLRVKGPHLEICKLKKKKNISRTVLSYYFVSIHRTKFVVNVERPDLMWLWKPCKRTYLHLRNACPFSCWPVRESVRFVTLKLWVKILISVVNFKPFVQSYKTVCTKVKIHGQDHYFSIQNFSKDL